MKSKSRDRKITLSEEERLMLRFMLVNKEKWIPAAVRAHSLHPDDDVPAALAAIGAFELKLAEING